MTVIPRRSNPYLYGLLAALLAAGMLAAAGAEELTPARQAQSDVQAARLEMGCGNLARAVELLQAARDLQPQWIVPHQYLALAYQAQADQEKAVAEYMLVQAQGYDSLPSGRTNPAESKEAILRAEGTTLWLVNKTRRENEVPLLRPEPRLAVVSREHSLEMRDLKYFDHMSPTAALRTPMDRFRAVFNFLPRCIAENIARRWGNGPCFTLENIADTHQDFLNSPPHRENILLTEVGCAGVGIAINAQGNYWLTEDFAKYSGQE
jgi:uncharacterized protein YkwD